MAATELRRPGFTSARPAQASPTRRALSGGHREARSRIASRTPQPSWKNTSAHAHLVALDSACAEWPALIRDHHVTMATRGATRAIMNANMNPARQVGAGVTNPTRGASRPVRFLQPEVQPPYQFAFPKSRLPDLLHSPGGPCRGLPWRYTELHPRGRRRHVLAAALASLQASLQAAAVRIRLAATRCAAGRSARPARLARLGWA